MPKLSEVSGQPAQPLKLSQVQPKAEPNPANRSDFARLITGKPKEPGFLDQLGRTASLGGRSILHGVYDLSGLLGGDLINAAESKIRGVQVRSQRENADYLADKLGLARPETTEERVSDDVSSALVGSGGIMGIGRGLLARAPGVAQSVGEALTAAPRTQIASTVAGSGAASATREAGGGPVAQTVAGLAGGLSPTAIRSGGSAAVRGLVRGGEAGRKAMQSTIDDFRSLGGATPSVGQATGRRSLQGVENLLAGGPTSAGVMTNAAEQQAARIGEGLQQRGTGLSRTAGGEQAGRAIERGADTFANNVTATRKALYWQADRFIPETTNVPMARTQQALADLTTPNLAAPNTTAAMVNPKIAQLADNISADLAAAQSQGGLPYSAVRDIRTRIGEALSDFSLTTDKPTAEYKRLYAALSQDIEQAAKTAGPAAEAALKRANTYFKASADRLEQLERVVDKAGGPEAVYNAALSGTRDGSTTLRAVMQSLPKDGQRALTGAVVKRMGLATPGMQDAEGGLFSAQTFLKNWNQLSPEARRTLFDRHGPKFAADMDRVARVAANVRDGSRVFANPSGTANKAAAYAYGASLAGTLLTGQLPAAGALVASGVGANALARAMTSPKFVSWLAKATEVPASALPQQLLVLRTIAAQDPEVSDLVSELEKAGQPVNQQANGANR